MLVDDGRLVRDEASGEWAATGDLAGVHVPPTISALLSARLDRLSDQERAVLEAAAVAGKAFHRGAVEALLPGVPRPASTPTCAPSSARSSSPPSARPCPARTPTASATCSSATPPTTRSPRPTARPSTAPSPTGSRAWPASGSSSRRGSSATTSSVRTDTERSWACPRTASSDCGPRRRSARPGPGRSTGAMSQRRSGSSGPRPISPGVTGSSSRSSTSSRARSKTRSGTTRRDPS